MGCIMPRRLRFTHKTRRTSTTGWHGMTQKQMRKGWVKTYRNRKKIQNELNSKEQSQKQKENVRNEETQLSTIETLSQIYYSLFENF